MAQIINNYNLRDICQRFFNYGAIKQSDIRENVIHNVNNFDQRYYSEKLDSIGSLYLLEIQFYSKDEEYNVREIYSNILMTSHNEAMLQRSKLHELMIFAKDYINKNETKFDTVIHKLYDTNLADDEYDFLDEYHYLYEIARYDSIDIICLDINNSDFKLDTYYDKYFKKSVSNL